MKRISIFLISLLIGGTSFGQSITEVYIPRYVQGAGTGSTSDECRVPFVCRLTVNGLAPNKAYRYFNRFVAAADTAGTSASTGLGTYILVKQTGNFLRVTAAPSLGVVNRYGEFKTDATGSYTGWFINEVSTTASIFFPGNTIYFRLSINDGSDSTSATVGLIDKRISASGSPITIINFGTAANTLTGTAIRSTPAASGIAKNFVMLYDNTAGAGRPVAGTVIESDGVDNTTANGYAPFYATDVNNNGRAWGTIIPNNLGNGIQKIVQYSLADGSKVGSKSAAGSTWPTVGGGTVSTVNPNTGLNTVIVIDGAAAPLGQPVSQTITFNALAAKTYGEADFNPGATASSGLPVIYTSSDPSVATVINGNTIHITGAGTTTITATQPGDDDYTVATNVSQSLTVNKANLTIKADDQFWLQGAPMPALTVSYISFVNGDDASDLNPAPDVTTSATPSSPLGAYPITVNNAGSPNYNITYQPGTITIVSNKQPQTITFNSIPAKVYGNADFAAGATVSSPLAITYTSSDPNVATINANNQIHILRAGTTTITASQAGDNSYDPAQSVSQLLTVNKAPLTITADNKRRLLNQSNPAFTVVYSGFVNNENNTALLVQPVISTTATCTSPAGTYPIHAHDALSDKYDITYVDGVLTIDALSGQTIQFPALTVKKYGDANIRPGATASSGLTVTYKSSDLNVATIENNTEIHIVGVGTAVITASQTGNGTYASAPDVTQTLSVQKAVLSIRANDYKRNEGEANPSFTVTYSGFVNGDDSSKLASLPVVNTTANAASVAGAYRISVQGAASPNYTINQQNGILTVLPAQGEEQDNISAYISSPGQLQITIYAANSVKVSNQLFDLNGSRLVNTTVTLNKGFNSYRIPVGNLSAGIYNVRVAGNGVMLKTKVVIR